VDVVSVITIGTSANAYGNGYGGGQKTLVWADPLSGAVMNFHRMGPGTNPPPSYSGYLGYDLGVNNAMAATDWSINQQAYAATLNNGGTYYLDAGRYPQGVLFDPMDDGVDESYVAFFAPNLSNGGTWGGYSYGRSKVSDLADSTKHMYWYSPPPDTYIPEGMMLLANETMLVAGKEYNETDGYFGNIILSSGVWNPTDMDFEYTMSLIEHPTLDNGSPACIRIAASPSGKDVWIVSIANTGDFLRLVEY